jgi:hypothetical protein
MRQSLLVQKNSHIRQLGTLVERHPLTKAAHSWYENERNVLQLCYIATEFFLASNLLTCGSLCTFRPSCWLSFWAPRGKKRKQRAPKRTSSHYEPIYPVLTQPASANLAFFFQATFGVAILHFSSRKIGQGLALPTPMLHHLCSCVRNNWERERESWAFLEQILCLLSSIVHSLYILLVRGQIIPLHIYKPFKTREGGWDLPLNHNIARLTLSILKMYPYGICSKLN